MQYHRCKRINHAHRCSDQSTGDARLVLVILRGALDGLAAVPPLGEDLIYPCITEALRKGILSLD